MDYPEISSNEKIGSRVPWDQPVSSRSIQKLLELCNICPGCDFLNLRLLDFGCGNGRYLEVFAEWIPKKNLFGVEISLDRVAQVNEKGFGVLPLNPETTYLSFKDQSFDIIFSSNVIEHISRDLYLRYLVEIYRILKPGGRFVVGAPNYPIKRLYDLRAAFTTEFMRYYLFDDPTHCNKLSILQLERDLSEVFQVVHLEPTHIFLQGKIGWLRKPKIRRLMRVFGNKIVGYCIK